MPTIEIRLNRKIQLALVSINPLALVGIGYHQLSSGIFAANQTYAWIFFLFLIICTGWSALAIKKLIINAPVLTLSESEIKLLVKNKTFAFAWKEITNWQIGTEGEHGKYLTVYAGKNNQKVHISALEKKPEEIEKLIRAYMNASEN